MPDQAFKSSKMHNKKWNATKKSHKQFTIKQIMMKGTLLIHMDGVLCLYAGRWPVLYTQVK